MNKNNSLGFTFTILISGIVIASAIYISRTNFIGEFLNNRTEVEILENSPNIQPITKDDHILGNPDADVIVIEYGDFECVYCQEFHTTMRRIMDNFGEKGRVAWVYRQLPLDEIHINAKRVALTSECIAENGGNAKFWEFTNKIYDNAPESLLKNNTDQIVSSLGFNIEEIDQCIKNPETIAAVENDMKDGKYFKEIDADFGTPYNIILTKTGISTSISGSISYQTMRDVIEQHSLAF